MIPLKYEPCDDHKKYTAVGKIEMTLDDEAAVPEILQAVRQFLLAAGYVLKPGDEIEVTNDKDV